MWIRRIMFVVPCLLVVEWLRCESFYLEWFFTRVLAYVRAQYARCRERLAAVNAFVGTLPTVYLWTTLVSRSGLVTVDDLSWYGHYAFRTGLIDRPACVCWDLMTDWSFCRRLCSCAVGVFRARATHESAADLVSQMIWKHVRPFRMGQLLTTCIYMYM